MKQCTEAVSQETMSATKHGILVQQGELTPLLSSVSFSARQEQADADRLVSTVQRISRDEIREAQKNDPALGKGLQNEK